MVYDKNSTIDFWDAVNNLMSGIKDDYYNWTNPDGVEGNIKDIKLKSIQDFNESLNIKVGRKYTKVLQGSSVWGLLLIKMEPTKEYLIEKVMSSKLPVGERLLSGLEEISLTVVSSTDGQVLIT